MPDKKDDKPKPPVKGDGKGDKDAQKNKGAGKPADDNKSGKDGINRRTMASRYGFALAFMESDPELKKLFNNAVRNTWAPEMFVARLRDTEWFKKNSANVRNAIMQETADPATYESNLQQMMATVQDTWGALFGEDGTNPKELKAWAETAHRMGWSEAQLIDRMTRGVDFQKTLTSDRIGGKAAEVKGQLDSLLSNYGLKMGDNWKASQLEKLVEGNDTVEGLRLRVQEMAMREYSGFADRIQGGETLMDIADPYMSKMADLLELNPHDVNLQNDLIQKALKQQAPDGKPAAMDLYSFEKEVRADQRWQYTKNARQEVSGVTEKLLRSFGVLS